MKISEKFGKGRAVLSFEVFPPKKTSSVNTIYDTLDKLKSLNPDFISVTYGAGGTATDNTCEIASKIKNDLHIEAVAHLTCVNSTKQEVALILERFKENNIENILALRGDISPDIEPKNDFKYASELCSFIKETGNFGISGACYPEVHLESDDEVSDILNLKHKVDCGAEHLMSQLFFDNSVFYRFLERTRIAGINVPIEAGIMPVTNKNQIEKMVSMCGASLPAKFTKIMQKYEHNPEALRDAGIAYAVEQIVDLLANNVDGIHLYTMNNAYVAEKISSAVSSLL
ncbi:MAG: methylenetetrahydrofolate reductase [NAD(P)H] [Acutalibacteraceae bacterium]